MNRFYVVAFAIGAVAVPAGIYFNAAPGVQLPPAVQIAGPRDGRGRFGRGGFVGQASVPQFVLTKQLNFARPSQQPACSVLTSGVYDQDCIMQCGIFPWIPGYDGGFACVRADAGYMTISNQPNNLAVGNSPFMTGDGGWFGMQTFTDDTVSSSATLQVDDSEIRAAFAGPHTIVDVTYARSNGPDPTGWFAMITDGTNQMQLRRGGGSNLQLVETPNIAASGGECLDNWCVMVARNGGDGGINLRQGGNLSANAATTIAAISGTNKLFIGGGTGGCCAPGGAAGGPVATFTMYRSYKSDLWSMATDRAVWGAQDVASGPSQAVGDIGIRIARYDLDKAGGGLPVLGVGAYFMDPITGAHTNQIYHVLGPVDLLDGGTLVGSAVWRGHFDQGPFYNWKHQNAAGVLSMESAGVGGMVLGSIGGDAGIISTNASFIGTAFTDGGYGLANAYFIQNVCTGGAIDGGFDHCSGTVSGNGVFARYPIDGCPMECFGATGAIQSVLYVGDAGATGALEVAQIQMTDTLEVEPPSVTNAQVSAQYLEIDAGSYLYTGCQAGKITATYQTDYSSAWYPGTPISGLAPPGTGAYLFDISNSNLSHDLLMWTTVENTTETIAAGNASTLDSVMYGSDPNYITPNKFAQSGQYDGRPMSFAMRTYYGSSLEWDVEVGTLPDGGTGSGSRVTELADTCADQSQPFACVSRTLKLKNTGQMGLCPGTPDTFEVGTRQLGSGPSTSHVHHINVCGCPVNRCIGDCQ